MTGHDSFIPPALIARARTASCEPSGPLVIGYDPAWLGGDRHAMALRRGRRLIKVESTAPPRHRGGGRLGAVGDRPGQAGASCSSTSAASAPASTTSSSTWARPMRRSSWR